MASSQQMVKPILASNSPCPPLGLGLLSLPPELLKEITNELTSNFSDTKALKAYHSLAKTCHHFYDLYYLDSCFLAIYHYHNDYPFFFKNVNRAQFGYEPIIITAYFGTPLVCQFGKKHLYYEIERVRKLIKSRGDLVIGFCSWGNLSLLEEMNVNNKDDNGWLNHSFECFIWAEGGIDTIEDSMSWSKLGKRGLQLINLKSFRDRFGRDADKSELELAIRYKMWKGYC